MRNVGAQFYGLGLGSSLEVDVLCGCSLLCIKSTGRWKVLLSAAFAEAPRTAGPQVELRRISAGNKHLAQETQVTPNNTRLCRLPVLNQAKSFLQEALFLLGLICKGP